MAAALILLSDVALCGATQDSASREGRIASGPARGTAGRFGRILPSDVAAVERASAAGDSAAIPWLPEHEISSRPDPDHPIPSAAPPGADETNDRAVSQMQAGGLAPPLIVGFPGPSPNAVVPPDPIIAAGPNHVIVAVNSAWAIFSKSGATLFQTSAASWFLPQLPALRSGSLVPYDPQVAYDQFSGRWILVYVVTDTVSQSWILLSASSSADPTGPWHSWALRGDTNGDAEAGNFSDFPALGFDDAAIYLATNQFGYSSREFAYAKIRVLEKDQVYAGSNSLAFSDFWNLADPTFPGERPHSLRPAQTFGDSGVEYLVSNSPFETRTYVTLWSLTGARTFSPVLSAVNVPVTATKAPPGANQLGGSPGSSGCPTPCLIQTGTGSITSAVSRNGSLWFSHTVADSTGGYCRARYARINLAARAPVEDEAFGSDGCWYFYPAVAVDAGNNLVMVFGRSCPNEYASVRFAARSTADSSLQTSTLLKAGENSYVVAVGNDEPVNRWGDFFGAAVDPADDRAIWLVGEYAASPRNTFGNFVGQTAVMGASGNCVPSPSTLCLGNGRFRATATWRKADGTAGAGSAVPITGDTGYFWFFSPSNIEVVTKVLNGCSVGGHYWVFAGGLTNVAVTLSVADTQTGEVRDYENPLGTPFAPIQDTSAFATCP